MEFAAVGQQVAIGDLIPGIGWKRAGGIAQQEARLAPSGAIIVGEAHP